MLFFGGGQKISIEVRILYPYSALGDYFSELLNALKFSNLACIAISPRNFFVWIIYE